MNTMSRLLLSCLLLLFTHQAQAHLFAPSLLKIVETSTNSYQIVWKTPLKTVSGTPLLPAWPGHCQTSGVRPSVQEGTGMVTSWTLRCEGRAANGLVGETLGVSGLALNQASVMVSINLLDDRHYQTILNSEQPEYVVPIAPSQSNVMTDYSGGQHDMLVLSRGDLSASQCFQSH